MEAKSTMYGPMGRCPPKLGANLIVPQPAPQFSFDIGSIFPPHPPCMPELYVGDFRGGVPVIFAHTAFVFASHAWTISIWSGSISAGA